jgi:hypothetical protein
VAHARSASAPGSGHRIERGRGGVTLADDRVAPVARIRQHEHEEVMENALGMTSGVGAHQRGPAPMGWQRRDGAVAFRGSGGAPANDGGAIGSYSSGRGTGQ